MMSAFKDALEVLQKTDATETPDVYGLYKQTVKTGRRHQDGLNADI